MSNRWIAIAVVALAQIAALAWMVIDRVSLLANGREIVLDVVPVDPRSLFRGDYVILSYDISRLDGALVPAEAAQDAPVYVTIRKSPSGKWEAIKVAPSPELPETNDDVVLRARLNGPWGPGTRPHQTTARYGIESYFVPEGKGRELEKLVGEKKIAALVAVDRSGNAAIKGLVVDGSPVYDEPLF